MSLEGPEPNLSTSKTAARIYAEQWRQALALAVNGEGSAGLEGLLAELQAGMVEKWLWIVAHLQMVCQWKMVIFHSSLYVYQRETIGYSWWISQF